MEVEVFNQSRTGHRTPLGKASISLKSLIAVQTNNEKTDFKISLVHENKQQGFILMKGYLTVPEEVEELKVIAETNQKSKPLTNELSTGNSANKDKVGKDLSNNNQVSAPMIPNLYKGSSKTLSLILNNLEAKELFDTGTNRDKQDPSLHIKIGQQSFSTNR